MNKSKIFQAILEVSFGGMLPFNIERVASQLGEPVRAIEKRINKLKRKGIIKDCDTWGYAEYVLSYEAFCIPEAEKKRNEFLKSKLGERNQRDPQAVLWGRPREVVVFVPSSNKMFRE